MNPLEMLTSPFKLTYRYSPLVRDLPEGLRRELRFIFDDHVTFDPVERSVMARERGALPADIVGAVAKPRPYLVVVPRERGDLLEALRLAERHGLPVTPRGNGTSTNGAAVPAEGGIVVDMRPFNELGPVNAEEGTVECGPGVTFDQLKAHLAPHGLAPRVEPELPWASTVGGSVALGRFGVGSARWGSIGAQVVEATVLGPDRRTDVVKGDDLDLVRGLQGSTGFLLWLKLKVGHAAEPEPHLLQFDTREEAAAGFRAMMTAKPWHCALLTPDFISLRQEASGVKGLQEKFHVLAVVPKGGDHADLVEAAKAKAGGKALDAKAAAKEWEQRSAAISLHRLGPTVVTAECLVPLDRLEEALRDLPDAARSRQCTDVLGAGPHHVLVRVHLLEDERRMEFPLSLGNLFAVVDAARALGGSAAYPSMLLAGESRAALGEGVMRRLTTFKQRRDPWEVMNPGKVWPARMRGMPMAKLSTFISTQKPILKALRGAVPYKGLEQERAGDLAVAATVGRGHAGDLALLAESLATCSNCGKCNTVAPDVGLWESLRPRGQVQAARALMDGSGRYTARLSENVARIPLHRAGDAVCPSRIPIRDGIIALRTEVHATLGAPAVLERMATNVAKEQNPWGKPKAQRAAWVPEGVQASPGAKVLYYAGSAASYERPQVARAGLAILAKLGPVNFLGAAEPDAGEALYLAGLKEQAAKQAEACMKALLKAGCEVVVTPDANVAWVAQTFWPQVAKDKDIAWTIQVQHAPAYLLPLAGKALALPSQVAEKVHLTEACCGEDAASAKLLAKVPGLQVQALGVLACGAPGGTREAHPDSAEKASLRALAIAQGQGATTLASSDPLCEAQLAAISEKAKKGIAVVDVLQLVARAMGLELPGEPAPGAPAPAPAAAAAPAGAGAAAKPKLSPEELEARKKAALEKAAAMKAQKEKGA
jgi:FAD/FMN-containing dehydrogenase/Fe-S oxidoreductase